MPPNSPTAIARSPEPTLAKVVATLGPASDSPETIGRLIDAGVDVFRLNFSHGTFAEHERRLHSVRRAAAERERPIAVLGDLQGPKIRLGHVPPGDDGTGISLNVGQDVVIVPETGNAATDLPAAQLNAHTVRLTTPYTDLIHEVLPGHRVLINDGAVRMLAVERADSDPANSLRCRVLIGGSVSTGKGINLPDSDVCAPAVTEKDWECVEWAVRHAIDFLALSFVRSAEDVRILKRRLSGMCSIDSSTDGSEQGAMIPVIAKIEKPQALREIDAIVEASDGIMVARGDLGVEMDLWQVPVFQKRIIARANDWGKPCIVATQMLETMIGSASPTRAEASDVANAVLDGADAVMLSGETAVGRYPVLTVETMKRIVAAAESSISDSPAAPSPPGKLVESRYRTAALAHGAWHIASDIGAKLVVCWSQQGGTARYLSQNGFRVPIVAYSSNVRETRRMAILKGVIALHAPGYPSPEGTLARWNRQIESELISRGWVEKGDPVLLVAGTPLGLHGATTGLAIHYIGNPRTGYMSAE